MDLASDADEVRTEFLGGFGGEAGCAASMVGLLICMPY